MAKGQIFKNHTLKEYQEKYGKNTKLIQFSKEEVSSFNKSNEKRKLTQELGKNYSDFLLADRSWWLIGDTYYEVPVRVKGAKGEKVKHSCAVGSWFRTHKKKAIIIGCVFAGTCGLLAGGHFLTAYLLENRSIRQKLGGKDITAEEAYAICENFDNNIKFADSVDFNINLKKFEIKDAILTDYEQEEPLFPIEIPFSVSWSGLNYKNSITYQEMILLKGGDSKESSLVPTRYLTSVSTFLFHQTYTYVIGIFEKFVGQLKEFGDFEYGYLNNKGALGVYITIPNLKEFFSEKSPIEGVNFYGDGKLEFGCRVNKDGFVEKFLLKVSGKDITYLSDPNEDGKTPTEGFGVKGAIDINIDASMTRKYAEEINIDYYINEKLYAETGMPIKLKTMTVRDPLSPEKEIGELSYDGRKYITNREYWAEFEITDSTKYDLDLYKSGIIIDGVDYTKSSDPSFSKLCYIDSANNAISINYSLMNKNHKIAVSLYTKEIK